VRTARHWPCVAKPVTARTQRVHSQPSDFAEERLATSAKPPAILIGRATGCSCWRLRTTARWWLLTPTDFIPGS